MLCNFLKTKLSYLPTPPLGQDMTQGYFLEEFNRFELRGFLLEDWLPEPLIISLWFGGRSILRDTNKTYSGAIIYTHNV